MAFRIEANVATRILVFSSYTEYSKNMIQCKMEHPRRQIDSLGY